MALTGAVGAINVKVSADATGFNATMNKVGSKVSATASKVRESSNVYAKWGAVAAAAAFAVGTAMVKNQMKVMDSLAKTSDALGVQQKQLQALQHVAELTGTGAAQLSVNLERMQRRIGEVARKGGQAEAALSEIGIAAREMISLPADEQLVRISQAMAGVDNASIRASIAMDLFGRDGVRMLKLMEQLGKEGLAPTVSELEKMGVALSRIDTAKVEQANDSLFRTQQVLDGVVNKVAVRLSPLITQLGEDFLDAAKDANGFDTSIVNAMSNAQKVVGVFADGLHMIGIIFKGLELAAKTMGLIVVKVMQGAALGVQAFLNSATNQINTLIDNVNLIPGVSIPAIKKFELAAVASFKNLADKASSEVGRISSELHDMAMETLPSEQLNQWVINAQASADEVANALNNVALDGTGTGGGSDLGLTNEEKAGLQKRLDTISESLKSESQIRQDALKNNLNSLKTALDNNLIQESEYIQKVKELRQQAADEDAAQAAPELAGIQSRLDAVSQSIMSERELRNSALNDDVSALKDALDKKLITETEYTEKVKALRQKAADEVASKKGDELAKIQTRLDNVQQGLMTETELKRLALENDLAVLQEALANELLTRQEHDAQVKALKQKTSSEITEIEDKAKKERDNLAELEKKTKVNAVGNTFSALSTLMNSQSKKLFEIGKAAAIGSAIVDGYKAVAKTMSETPYPFNIPLAAAQAAASAVQVQGIAKQKFGGAGGGANQFSAGVPAVNTTGGGGGGGFGDRNVSISGLDPSALFSGEQVRDLLKNLAGDGADFTFLNSGG
jgi:hypothetical protein